MRIKIFCPSSWRDFLINNIFIQKIRNDVPFLESLVEKQTQEKKIQSYALRGQFWIIKRNMGRNPFLVGSFLAVFNRKNSIYTINWKYGQKSVNLKMKFGWIS